MARMNTGLMIGGVAAAGGLLWLMMGRGGRVTAPKDSGGDVNAMSYEELVAHTLKVLGGAERAAWDQQMLDLAVDGGLDLRTAGADEIEAAMNHQERLAGDEIIRAAKDAAYASTEDFSQFSTMTRPPQGTIDRAIAYVKSKDPDVRVLPAESFAALHAAGQLPQAGSRPAVLVFVSDKVSRAVQSGGGSGFLLMSGQEVVRRLTVAAGAATAGAAGYGDYVQMPYSGGMGDYVQMPYSGFGAMYGEKGGSGVTGLGY
jgi:hypothetical protein